MEKFRVLYYPNSDCHPLVLAKAILVFDEVNFFDHPSITFSKAGTVGHNSGIRNIADNINKEGFRLNVCELPSGRVENELSKLIDSDLKNPEFRKVFFQLVRNDPTFLMTKVPNGNYGMYGSAEEYRKRLVELTDDNVPHSVEELNQIDVKDGITPELNAAMIMASDSHMLNFSTFLAADKDLDMFGESVGMEKLLCAKVGADSSSSQAISSRVAYKLLDSFVPNTAFRGKTLVDIVRFRNKVAKDREKFKEHILELTVDIQSSNEKGKKQRTNEIVYQKLLPEARKYQNALADNWDEFFKESSKAVIAGKGQTTQLLLSILPISFSAALLAGAVEIGSQIMPHLIDYLKGKEAIERKNPFSYLMKFR